MVTITTTTALYKVGRQQATGYEARPVGRGPFPGVVVLIEWWGLEPHIKDVTERFAREGFIALAPDLYHGKVIDYDHPDEAMATLQAFDHNRGVQEVDSAIRYIKAQSASNKKVGVVGYCFGGGVALLTAVHSKQVDAANPYYGANPDPIELVERIRCPVLGFYASQDEAHRPSVAAIEGALHRYGKEHEIHVYDAPHAFFNDRRPSYREEAATDAWQRTLAFFRQRLS